MSSIKCLFPFSSLTIEPDGIIQLCPSSSAVMGKVNHENGLERIWTSSRFDKVRSNFQNGIFPEECRNCQKVEGSGQLSRRQRILERGYLFFGDKKNKEALALTETKQGRILELNLSFSNKCNLKCAMCSSRYSHSWNQDELEARSSGIDFRESAGPVNFDMDDNFFNSIIEELGNIRHLMIKGGEPFLAPQTFKLLQHLKFLKEKGEEIPSIYIQTNGTVVNDLILSLISELEIEIGISIDGTGESYEWIRGFSYETISKNIALYLDAVTGDPMSLDFTASIFNLFHIKEAFENLMARFGDHPHFYKINYTIARQPYNDLRAISRELRASVAQELRMITSPKVNDIENLCRYIESEDLEQSKQKFALQWLCFLETKRGEIPEREKYMSWIEEIKNV